MPKCKTFVRTLQNNGSLWVKFMVFIVQTNDE